MPTTRTTLRLAIACLGRLAGGLGCVLLPRETFEALSVFKTRAEAAEAALAAEAEAKRDREMHDGTALVRQLSHLAGTELPKAVKHATALFDELRDQRVRGARAELEATRLATALVEDEFPETTD